MSTVISSEQIDLQDAINIQLWNDFSDEELLDHLDMATRYCALLNELPIAREYNDSLIAFMHHLEAQG